MRYRVTHHTPAEHDAGTNEWVFIHLRGPQGEFDRLIDSPGEDREQGMTNTYIIEGPEIRPITAIGFRMERDTDDANYKWLCGSVKVENLDTGYSVYIERFGWVDRFSHVFWVHV